MNRFLKKEWEQTEIPESVRLRARNRAWSRLHGPSPVAPRKWIWAAAAAAAVLLVIVASQRRAAPTAPLPTLPIAARGFEPVAPARPELSPASAVPAVKAPKRDAPSRVQSKQLATVSPQESPPAPVEPSPAPRQTQLVSTFQLAETGVRMIWVQDANFFRETGDSP